MESLLDIDAMLEALERALKILSSGITSVPPRTAARVPDLGLMGTMAGYVPGIALEVKLVSVFPGNDARGLPSHQALIALFDEDDGAPLAVMDGTYITAIRTGGTAAVAARALARDDAKVLAILGAGAQGASHLETFTRVRDFTEIRVASRDHARAAALAARASDGARRDLVRGGGAGRGHSRVLHRREGADHPAQVAVARRPRQLRRRHVRS